MTVLVVGVEGEGGGKGRKRGSLFFSLVGYTIPLGSAVEGETSGPVAGDGAGLLCSCCRACLKELSHVDDPLLNMSEVWVQANVESKFLNSLLH